jgi:hypothetical protein
MNESTDIALTKQTSGTLAKAWARYKLSVVGLIVYLGTTAVVVFGVCLGQTLVKPGQIHRRTAHEHWAVAFASWDGHWYARIADEGYTYIPGKESPVGFFPLYPLAAAGVHWLTGLDVWLALLIVSHVCLAAAFVVAGAYVRLRHAGAPEALADYVLLALGLFPPTLFFRMAYSESLFLLLTLLALFGMERRWPILVLGLLIGLSTAVRLTGLALVPPFLLHLCRRSTSWRRWAGTAAWAAPLACWGIAAFMLYQWALFGEPLAYMDAQMNAWRHRPPVPFAEKLFHLVTFEPVGSRFDPASPLYWRKWDSTASLVLNYTAADPVLFLTACGLIFVGWTARWLSAYELLVGAGFLLIAYAGRGYEIGMSCSARYASVVFPMYLVLGQVLVRVRLAVAVAFLVLCGVWLACFSALFSVWHRVL